jgi:hypothetical protein
VRALSKRSKCNFSYVGSWLGKEKWSWRQRDTVERDLGCQSERPWLLAKKVREMEEAEMTSRFQDWTMEGGWSCLLCIWVNRELILEGEQ